MGQLDNDVITGTHTPASQNDGHYAGFADQLAVRPPVEHRRQQSLLPVIDLSTGIAKTSNFENHFLADPKVCSPRETKQVYPHGRDVLAEVSRANSKTLLCDFVEQFGMNEVHLAKIWLGWISLDPRTMLHRHAPVRISVYAADLLLPGLLFAPMAKRCGRATFEAVDQIRAEFQTSRTATALRMVDYGPEPALLVCHGPNGRRWFKRGPAVPDRWFPRNEIDADSDALEVLHGTKERTTRSLIGAEAWFDRWDAERYEVYEQTVRMSTGDALSLVVIKSAAMLD